MSTNHYDCGGDLEPLERQAYVCSKCGRTVRSSVIESHDSFRRVAESDGPLSDIAEAALEGYNA